MNLFEVTRTYRNTIHKSSDGSAQIRLELDRVKSKRRRVLTHVTVENETTAYTKVRLAIKRTNRTHYLDELATPGAAELAVSRSEIILEELDQFFALLSGTTSGDVLRLTAIGWETDL